jgi:hypothetical protein
VETCNACLSNLRGEFREHCVSMEVVKMAAKKATKKAAKKAPAKKAAKKA